MARPKRRPVTPLDTIDATLRSFLAMRAVLDRIHGLTVMGITKDGQPLPSSPGGHPVVGRVGWDQLQAALRKLYREEGVP